MSETFGNLVHFSLTAGQAHDCPQAEPLLKGIFAGFVIADKAYDSNSLRELIKRMGAEAVIPSKSNRTQPPEFDKEVYKNRNLIERFFNKLKQFRRIATRYDKLSRRFAAFILISAAVIWARG